MGLYALLSIAFIILMTRVIARGTSTETTPHLTAPSTTPAARRAE